MILLCKFPYSTKQIALQKPAHWISCLTLVLLKHILSVAQSDVLKLYIRLCPFPAQKLPVLPW